MKNKPRDGRRVLSFLKPYKKWIAADSFVITIAQVCGLVIPTLSLSWLVDSILPEKSSFLLWGLMWLLLLAGVLDLIMMVIDEYFCHYVAKSVTNRQKLRLFSHIHYLPYSFYQNAKSGELLARVSDDPDTLHNFFAWEGSTFMASIQGVILFNAVLFFIHPYLMIASVILGALFYFASSYVGARTRPASMKAREEASRYLERLRESVTGIHLARVSGVSEQEVESIQLIRKSFVEYSRMELKARMQSIVVMGSYNGLAISFVYLISVLLIWDSQLTSGQMLTAGGLVTIGANAMERMIRMWLAVRRTGPALDRSETLLSHPRSTIETTSGISKKDVQGELQFDNVVFCYPEKNEPTLKGLSFTIEPGTVTALVGPSGSGKSTIGDLLLRLYDPKEGLIKLDGIPLEHWEIGYLRSQMAFVSQDIQLRNGTLADNLKIGNTDVTEDEMIEVLHASGLSDYLEGLPNGLHSEIGERGNLLSGGQKQRLSLARALIRNAKILILDEASSALDPITELQINQAIRERKTNQTIVIISHRLSTVLSAEQIIVVENGIVVERGTHDLLLQQEDGVYNRLFKRETDRGSELMEGLSL